MLPFATDAPTSAADPASLLLVYGPLGLIAFLLIMYAKSTVKREHEKADAAEQQVKDLNDFIRNELLPKQVEATILHKQVAEVLGDAVRVISDLKYRDDPPRDGRRGT